MNAFWSLISHYLPSIRIYNDLDDSASDYDTYDDDTSFELPTTNTYFPASPQPQGQRHDRIPVMDDHPATYNQNRHRWDPNARGEPRTDEDEGRHKKEVEDLKTQVHTLHHQLVDLQSDLSSTKDELQFQRSSNSHLLSQNSRMEGELEQARNARHTRFSEMQQLRASYADVSASMRTLETHNEELATLKSFLNKTDDYTGAQILQAVQDLNTEIVQLASVVSEEFPLDRQKGDLSKESDFDIVRNSIGEGMLELLRECDHNGDPTVVQLAIQAWETWCCKQILDSFCFGLPPEISKFLNEVFREMQLVEPQPTTSRWRALTHTHARTVLSTYPREPAPAYPTVKVPAYSGSSSSSAPTSPLFPPPYPTPQSTLNNTPASQIYALPQPHSRTHSNSSAYSLSNVTSSHISSNIRGLLAILALSGCTDERGIHREPLRARFGDQVTHVADRAEALSRMIREGVGSAWFEVLVESAPEPGRNVRSRSVGNEVGVDGLATAQWKEKEKGSAEDREPWRRMYDPALMENVYAGHGNERSRVLCSVEFGLSLVKKRPQTSGNGGGDEWQRRGVKGASSADGRDDMLESTLLLKPKVLLESVKELL